MIAATLRRHPLVVTGVRDPAPLRACGIEATSAPAEALAPPDSLVVTDPFARLPRYAP
jgi:hypothetical protein